MKPDDSVFLIQNRKSAQRVFKMTKTRTAMFLVMITLTCGLIFAITDAYPTPEAEPVQEADTTLGNNSRLVITHVVKTIEFEVGIVDEDDLVEGNSTDSDASEFYETDIQLLNVDLLKEVVNQASGDEKDESDTKEEKTTGTMEPVQLMPNEPEYKMEKLTR